MGDTYAAITSHPVLDRDTAVMLADRLHRSPTWRKSLGLSVPLRDRAVDEKPFFINIAGADARRKAL